MGKSIFRCEQELPQTPNTAGLRNFRLHKELAALPSPGLLQVYGNSLSRPTSVSRLMKIWTNKTYNPNSWCFLLFLILWHCISETNPTTNKSVSFRFFRPWFRAPQIHVQESLGVRRCYGTLALQVRIPHALCTGVTLKSIEAGPAQFRAKYDGNTTGKDTKSSLQRSGWQVTAWQHR